MAPNSNFAVQIKFTCRKKLLKKGLPDCQNKQKNEVVNHFFCYRITLKWLLQNSLTSEFFHDIFSIAKIFRNIFKKSFHSCIIHENLFLCLVSSCFFFYLWTAWNTKTYNKRLFIFQIGKLILYKNIIAKKLGMHYGFSWHLNFLRAVNWLEAREYSEQSDRFLCSHTVVELKTPKNNI